MCPILGNPDEITESNSIKSYVTKYYSPSGLANLRSGRAYVPVNVHQINMI